MEPSLLSQLAIATPSKIVLLVLDGLGGLPHPQTGLTELETADTPKLDSLARRSICGLMEPLAPGITPGSGPAHLALFGYNPFTHLIGRGILEALGIDFPLETGDVAARGNFCTVDGAGHITDRRAGRLSTEASTRLCQALAPWKVGEVEIHLAPVREHRFAAVFRGQGLSDRVTDSDPQRDGLPPRPLEALSPEAETTAGAARHLVARAASVLARAAPANMILLRGFSCRPQIPSLAQLYQLRPAAIVTYPMYRGLARLVRMSVLSGGSWAEQLGTLSHHYPDFDFFYLHFKATDAAGEDGNFSAKVQALEEVDASIPTLLGLEPDVLIVTGDHSTPASLRSHSWHPVPFLLFSKWCRPDGATEFSERACAYGGLGRFSATQVMALALAHALKLDKFGA